MTPMQTLQATLRERLPQLELREREPMAQHTSFKVGGPVALMALPKEAESLPILLHCAWEAGVVRREGWTSWNGPGRPPSMWGPG